MQMMATLVLQTFVYTCTFMFLACAAVSVQVDTHAAPEGAQDITDLLVTVMDQLSAVMEKLDRTNADVAELKQSMSDKLEDVQHRLNSMVTVHPLQIYFVLVFL